MAYNTLKNSIPIKLGMQFCVIGEKLKENEAFIKSLKHYHMPIVYSSSGLELLDTCGEFATIFILEEFEGEEYNALLAKGQRILGPTVVMQYAMENKDLTNAIRPLYTASMKHVVISFTGFRLKEEVSSIVHLVHHMGGSIRRDFNTNRTTHLIATASSICGEKYKYAVSLGIPVMTKDWVYQVWARRHEVNCMATDPDFMQYKLLPFVGSKLAFLGYQSDDEQDMTTVALKNGGEIVNSTDPSCSHIVVADGHTIDFSQYEHEMFVVTNEWFWACIQMEARAEEELYRFKNPNSTLTSSSHIMPIRGNKRQRLESVAHQLAIESQENNLYYLNREFGRKSENVKLSISGSFLDATLSPDKSIDFLSSDDIEKQIKSPPLDMRSLSPRQQVCLELFQTESNYVSILHTIITVFKNPLEAPDPTPLLAPAEIKIIFGNLPPIYDIHQKIRSELAELVYSRDDNHSIGNLILNHAKELMKSYPPFVNFFEKSKEILANCDATKPRFHAFLKRCQSKPECGRQTLQELLIRPVQRLPSIILLLTDILKHTPKSNPDHQALEKAIQALKNVTMYINEDKRKTEGQMEMFDIVNDIENCPANLLSSHRKLVSKTDVQETTGLLSKKSDVLTLFLFTDVLEICKKRNKTANALKSPGVASIASGTLKPQSKSYKHLVLIQLSHIKRVADVTETEDCKNTFALVVWSNKELKECLPVFALLDEVCKMTFLRTLCRHIANSLCQTDAENLLTRLESEQLDLHVPENSGNALTKALNKTRSKIGRAWSFRSTPSKRSLTRAVSTIISPLRSFKQQTNHLSTLKLSSVTNLTVPEAHYTDFSISPIGGKKRKSNTVGASAAEHM